MSLSGDYGAVEMSLDRVLGIVGAIGVPTAIGAGLAMDTRTLGELRFAQACFVIATVVLVVFVVTWGLTSDARTSIRILVVFFLFGSAGLSLVEAVRWS